MPKIVVYSTKVCPYCRNAKQLLDKKGLSYEEILIDDEDPEQAEKKRNEMIARSGRRTVPQIFINDQSIGGFDDLSALNASGQLDDLLNGGTTHD